MKTKKQKINQSSMANKLIKQERKNGAELFRLFKVYHPVYEAEVNIETAASEDTYHIFEKYMDKLICGYTEDTDRIADRIYIHSKSELFALLGIDSEAYEIAEKFYYDLYDAGHFSETPKGIVPKNPAVLSVKLDKKMTERTQMEKRLFDVFSLRLMPADFYELDRYCVRKETKANDTYSVWLSEGGCAFRSAAEIENMINNSSYDANTDRIEFALPQGYKKMSVCAASDIEVVYYPYYLAVFRVGDKLSFEAYRIDDGTPIHRISEMYTSSHYTAARELILELCNRVEQQAVNAPHLKKTVIMAQNGVPNIDEGFFKREKDDNYIWELSDEHLGILLGIENPEHFSKGACNHIANDSILCLNNFDAGKLVFLEKTEKQRELILDCITASEDERKKLYNKYMAKVK